MWAVAKEYARQFGEIIGMEPEHWVGDCPDLCCFGDYYFFSLEEMREVVDGIGKYVKKYGSKDAVGEEIREWVDWWLEGISETRDELMLERTAARVTHQLRVNINLKSWLDGCPREDIKPFDGPDARLMRLKNAEDVVVWLIDEYREARTLGNVLENIRSQIKPLQKQKEERDKVNLLKFFDYE